MYFIAFLKEGVYNVHSMYYLTFGVAENSSNNSGIASNCFGIVLEVKGMLKTWGLHGNGPSDKIKFRILEIEENLEQE